MDKDISMEQKTWQVYSFGKRNAFRLHLNESREVLSERKGKVILCRWTKNRKCVGTSSGESGVRSLLFRNLLHATSIATPVPSLWLKT